MPYVFHTDVPDEATVNDLMLRSLAGVFDPFSRQQLRRTEVPADARCLVVAAGASNIPLVLAEMTPHGSVIATDIDLAACRRHPRVTLIRHDIVTDPLAADSFDLIHVRLLLGHLPQRRHVLAKLADALAPGGVLIVEEFEATWRTSVLAAPDPDGADRLFGAYHDAFQTVLAAAGSDPTWGRRAHSAMREVGLNTDTLGHTAAWTGGSDGCLLPWATAGILRPRLIDAGMPPAEIDAFRTLLRDPALVIKSNLALSHVGRRTG